MRCHEDQDSAVSTRGVLEGLFVNLRIKQRITSKITNAIRDSVDYALFQKFGCYMGNAILNYDKNVRLERQLYTALQESDFIHP